MIGYPTGYTRQRSWIILSKPNYFSVKSFSLHFSSANVVKCNVQINKKTLPLQRVSKNTSIFEILFY